MNSFDAYLTPDIHTLYSPDVRESAAALVDTIELSLVALRRHNISDVHIAELLDVLYENTRDLAFDTFYTDDIAHSHSVVIDIPAAS